MLKTVSSITNAIGALNFKGTWDANANSPALASSVGTKGDYYVVGTAGSTNLNGISNWGVGDLATFNGSVWQRVEGGADLNGVNLSVSGTSTLSGLTASTALALNASKEIVSVTNTGTGNNVLATSPTLATPVLGAATATSINKVALTAPATGSTLTIADGKTLTANQSLTLAGTDATTMTFPTTNATIARTDAAQSFTGDQTLATGNLVIGTSGKGIDFSVTSQATGMTSELFADYEEGAWTPIDASGASLTFSTANGTYEKIGRTVIARGIVIYPSTVDASQAVIGGLPYTVANADNARQGFLSLTTEATATSVRPNNNATTFPIRGAGAAGVTNATMSTDQVFFTILYYV